MSGGSHNYVYSRLSQECEGKMYDVEMNDLIKDLCEVLHDLEWWQSGDYSENQYRETVSEFKKKWLKGGRTNRPKGCYKEICEVLANDRNKMFKNI